MTTEYFDSYVGVLQRLIMWEQPLVSGAAFFAVHLIFWCLIRFEWRFYGVLFSAFLLAFLCDAGMEFVGCRSNNQSTNWSRPLVTLVAGAVEYLRVFRDKHPNTFRAYMVAIFLTLNVLGRAISGLTLTYLTLLFMFAAPAVVSMLPENARSFCKGLYEAIQSNNEVAEEDLMPLHSEKDIDNDSIAADSCTNSFVSGINSMPSYHEVEGSLDGLDDDDDLEISPSQVRGTSVSPGDSSDSDVEPTGITFECSHFNGDESSSSDESFARGVEFHRDSIDNNNRHASRYTTALVDPSSISVPSPAQTMLQSFGTSLFSNLGTMGSNLGSMGTHLATVVYKQAIGGASSAAVDASTREHSDSDSDFELVDTDDLNDAAS